MLKFSLIVPNTRYGSDYLWSILPSRGLLSLAACLKQNGFEVDYIDADILNLSHQSVLNRIDEFKADVVGITMNTFQVKAGTDLADAIRSHNKHLKIIAGGPHPSALRGKFLDDYPQIDVSCTGESEDTIVELAGMLQSGGELANVHGITYRINDKIYENPDRELIADLDRIPFPAYELVGAADRYPGAQPALKLPSMHIMASCGCPYECIFCTKSVWGNKVRVRKPEKVVEEVEFLHTKYGINEIYFQDDTMNAGRKWFFAVCDEIISRKLNKTMAFKTQFRVNSRLLDKKLLKKAKKAGFWMVFYGVESGNQTVLDTIKKRTTISEIERAFKLTHKAGIKTIAAFMVGNVGDTENTIKDSIELAKRIKPTVFCFSIATPLPGTDFYKIAKSGGWILSEDFSKWSQFTAVSHNADLTVEQITQLRDSADKHVREFFEIKGDDVMSQTPSIKDRIKALPVVGPAATRVKQFVKSCQQSLYLPAQSTPELKHSNNKQCVVSVQDQMKQQLKLIKKSYDEPKMTGLVSQLVTQEQVESEAFRQWCCEIKETHSYHRKLWEYVYVLQGLQEHNMLRSGMSGLGFGVGKEPLPALMAKRGCSVLATDMAVDLAEKIGWVGTNQHSNSEMDLNDRQICDPAQFNKLVSFMTADMNNIDPKIKSMKFDFIWSCCAVDHLGSIELAGKFLKETVKLLKPGGISIHTTEYNVLSNTDTLDNQGIIIFRRKDIDSLINNFHKEGYLISFNPHTGSGDIDMFVDMPPYAQQKHLKLMLGGYVSTSIGLLIKKPAS